jgi:putative PIN family toxin of toxin-antitoxin system
VRIILDTNVLIDGFSDDFSPQYKIIDAALHGQATALLSGPIEREYRQILRRLISDQAYKDRIERFIASAEHVTPSRVDVSLDDPDDYKFLQAAAGGQADYIITNDRHLLDLGQLSATVICSPAECWAKMVDETGSEWTDFATGLGIGR